MRYLPGYNPTIANESISSFHLIQQMVNEPDTIPTIFSLYKDRETPLSSILNMKGMKTKGLMENMMQGKYRVVGSNHVQYAIEATDLRKMHFKANSAGKTFESAIYSTEPGYKQSAFYVYLDSNWASPKEVLELDDNQTQLFIYDEQDPIETEPGVWRYEVKVKTSEFEDYVLAELMREGAECMPVQTAYEHDFSETGSEKYTFPTWGHAYLNLQRVKYSYSGTAQVMKESKKWAVHNGNKGFLTAAEDMMMERAARYHEYSTIFGRGTVTVDGKTILHDKRGREIMQGDGILNQGDGAYEFPYNTFNKKFLKSVMKDIDLRSGNDGVMECVLVGGKEVTSGFSEVMRDYGITLNQNIVGEGADKGINDSYSYYEFDGIRVVVQRWSYLDGNRRPTKRLSDGSNKSSFDGFFVPLGKTAGGDNQVELVQLRRPTMGTLSGINEGGNAMSTSVDGSSVHMLFQTGVISRAKITRIFRPYSS